MLSTEYFKTEGRELLHHRSQDNSDALNLINVSSSPISSEDRSFSEQCELLVSDGISKDDNYDSSLDSESDIEDWWHEPRTRERGDSYNSSSKSGSGVERELYFQRWGGNSEEERSEEDQSEEEGQQSDEKDEQSEDENEQRGKLSSAYIYDCMIDCLPFF